MEGVGLMIESASKKEKFTVTATSPLKRLTPVSCAYENRYGPPRVNVNIGKIKVFRCLHALFLLLIVLIDTCFHFGLRSLARNLSPRSSKYFCLV